MTSHDGTEAPPPPRLHALGGARVLVVAAHPDDETIGASALLGPLPGSELPPDTTLAREAIVLHVTDGAPRDRRWWPAGIDDRLAYARVRAREAEHALTHVGARRIALGIPDQEAVHELAHVARAIAEHIERHAPDLIVTHAYEGGHPDHDAVACAVARAGELVARPPPIYEMALYHGAGGGSVTGEFADARPALRHVLDLEQRRRRRAMIACFASQRATLVPFLSLAHECYRAAPRYDFAEPPHAGPLLYERLGLPITGAHWRAIAAGAAR